MDKEDWIELLRERFPDFVSTGKPLRGRKTQVLHGSLCGTPAIAKGLTRPDPVWRFYFAREVALYELFQKENPPVLTPRLLAVDKDAEILILSRLAGSPLAMKRACEKTPSPAASRALCEILERLHAWQRGLAIIPQKLPSENVIRAMRTRLLEDPSAPAIWMNDGVSRCVRWGLITDDDLMLIRRGIAASTQIVFGHGDLLPRNIICDGENLGVVDWECAGAYAEDWDRAQLWVAFPALRTALETKLDQQSVDRIAAFRSAVAFALLRELRFLQHFRGGSTSPRATTLRSDLQHILTRLQLRR